MGPSQTGSMLWRRRQMCGEEEALDHGEGHGAEASTALCCWQPAALLGHYAKWCNWVKKWWWAVCLSLLKLLSCCRGAGCSWTQSSKSVVCRKALGLKRLWLFGAYLLVPWKLKSGRSSVAPAVSPRLVVGLPALERVSEMAWGSSLRRGGAPGDQGVQCLSLQMRKPWPREGVGFQHHLASGLGTTTSKLEAHPWPAPKPLILWLVAS